MGDPGNGTAGYSMASVVRRTGLSEHLLRAWESRYGAVSPARTPGGSRRYSEADVARLELLREAVNAGHAISAVARLSDAALERLVRAARPMPVDEALEAAARLDAAELDRVLGVHFAALGAGRFARDLALPLLREAGDRWERGELPVAAEHLLSSTLRSILGAALRGRASRRPPILFTTPQGERHEFGILIAALVALGAGGQVLYLGPDLPASDVALAARASGASAVVLGLVALEAAAATAYLRELRSALPRQVDLWIGGPAGAGLPELPGVRMLGGVPALELIVSES